MQILLLVLFVIGWIVSVGLLSSGVYLNVVHPRKQQEKTQVCSEVCKGPTPEFVDGRCICTSSSCPSGTQCSTQTGECVSMCKEVCKSNQNCNDKGVCVSKCQENPCKGETPICDENGKCVCDDSSSCPSGHSCVGGACIQSCVSENQNPFQSNGECALPCCPNLRLVRHDTTAELICSSTGTKVTPACCPNGCGSTECNSNFCSPSNENTSINNDGVDLTKQLVNIFESKLSNRPTNKNTQTMSLFQSAVFRIGTLPFTNEFARQYQNEKKMYVTLSLVFHDKIPKGDLNWYVGRSTNVKSWWIQEATKWLHYKGHSQSGEMVCASVHTYFQFDDPSKDMLIHIEVASRSDRTSKFLESFLIPAQTRLPKVLIVGKPSLLCKQANHKMQDFLIQALHDSSSEVDSVLMLGSPSENAGPSDLFTDANPFNQTSGSTSSCLCKLFQSPLMVTPSPGDLVRGGVCNPVENNLRYRSTGFWLNPFFGNMSVNSSPHQILATTSFTPFEASEFTFSEVCPNVFTLDDVCENVRMYVWGRAGFILVSPFISTQQLKEEHFTLLNSRLNRAMNGSQASRNVLSNFFQNLNNSGINVVYVASFFGTGSPNADNLAHNGCKELVAFVRSSIESEFPAFKVIGVYASDTENKIFATEGFISNGSNGYVPNLGDDCPSSHFSITTITGDQATVNGVTTTLL